MRSTQEVFINRWAEPPFLFRLNQFEQIRQTEDGDPIVSITTMRDHWYIRPGIPNRLFKPYVWIAGFDAFAFDVVTIDPNNIRTVRGAFVLNATSGVLKAVLAEVLR
jgi:hypothetical protein